MNKHVKGGAVIDPAWSDPDAALAFLQQLQPSGPWTVSAIYPDAVTRRIGNDAGPVPTRSFNEPSKLRGWIAERSGVANLYFTANVTGTLNKKPSEDDVAAVQFVHVDIDDDEHGPIAGDPTRKARVISALNAWDEPGPPSFIIDSGGGVQALWRLYEDASSTAHKAECRGINQHLIQTFGGDGGTYNLDRLLRLPGTVNLPDERKRKRGRVPLPTKLTVARDVRYATFEFTSVPLARTKTAPIEIGDPEVTGNLEALGQKYSVPQRILTIVRDGRLPEPKAGDDSRSTWLFDAVCGLVRCRVPNEVIVGLLTDASWQISESVLEKPDPDAYAERQVAKAITKIGETATMEDDETSRDFATGVDRQTGPDEPAERPEIKLAAVRLTENLDLAEDALLRSGVGIYQMKGALVQIVRLDKESDADGVHHQQGALVIRALRPQRILELMLQSAVFLKFQYQQWIPCTPPMSFVNHFIARGEWRLRVLRGIIEAPTIRPDGTILAEQGYDPLTQVYLDTGGVEFPPVPEHPSMDDALEALAGLKDVIKDFPFVPDEDGEPGDSSASRSVALSAMLTGVCRKALRTAPAHAIDATTMATGKTLLCDVIGMLATGRSAASISQGQTREEFNKRLFSVLLQGDPVVVIDNIDQEVSSDEFCTVLTAPEWQNRVLGESETRVVPTNVLFLPNGNNIRFKGDMVTRVIACRMDSGLENPGARRFDRDLRVYVPENRPRLVVAALTILRAFVVAGRPGARELEPFARFEDWSNLVRGALIWLGEPDPLATRDALVAVDPERENLVALHRAWEAVIGLKKWVTAKQIIEAAQKPTDHNLGIAGGDELDDALHTLFGPHDIAVNMLGKYLVQFDGRIIDGVAIRKHAVNGKSTRFCLEPAD